MFSRTLHSASSRSVTPKLPDLNALTYPFQRVQELLDEAAYLNLHVSSSDVGRHTYGARNVFDIAGGFVLETEGVIRPFDAEMRSARTREGLGPTLGNLRSRWYFSPDEAGWSPSREPKPILFDPLRSQRFAVQDLRLSFEGTSDVCIGYGQGQTMPLETAGGHRVLAGAVCNITGGTGRFESAVGTIVLNGRVCGISGFSGNVTVRVLDPEGRFSSGTSLATDWAPGGDDEATYFVLRGRKNDPTTLSLYAYVPGDPVPVGLETPADLCAAHYQASVSGGNLSTRAVFGRPVGDLQATILFNVANPPGTAEHPNPFRTRNSYRFIDDRGRVIAGIRAEVQLGRSFGLEFDAAPGQGGLRYGGIGPIVGSSGELTGVQGMLSVNSTVGLAPHALSLLNVLRIVDPGGKYRNALTTRRRGHDSV